MAGIRFSSSREIANIWLTTRAELCKLVADFDFLKQKQLLDAIEAKYSVERVSRHVDGSTLWFKITPEQKSNLMEDLGNLFEDNYHEESGDFLHNK